ncbi:MAG: hypothetical protein R3D66_05465 [Alphaproteobacteria bacterium]
MSALPKSAKPGKAHDVTIYTVNFGGVNESTKDHYRECASSEDQHYWMRRVRPIDQCLRNTSELSNLHIKG